MVADTEIDILGRVIEPERNNLSPEVAEFILTLSFQGGDVARMNELAAKARDDALSDSERTELETYNHVGHLLSLLHSKARLSLREDAHTN